MAVTCYTVRPGPESGWITFFEIGGEPRHRGVFLILGPAATPPGEAGATARRDAQDVARRIVAAFKAARDPEPAELIGEVRRAAAAGRTPLEYGVLVTSPQRIAFLVDGRTRVLPLTAGARRRWENEAPKPGVITLCPVEPGDRYYLGRVPPEAAEGLAPSDVVERLERGGTADGALIVSVLAGEAQAAVQGPSGNAGGRSAGSSRPAATRTPAPAETEPSPGSKPPPGEFRESPPAAPAAPPDARDEPAPGAPIRVVFPEWMKDEPAVSPEPPPATGAGTTPQPPPPEDVPLAPRRTDRDGYVRGAARSSRLSWGLVAAAVLLLAGYVLFVRPAVRRSARDPAAAGEAATTADPPAAEHAGEGSPVGEPEVSGAVQEGPGILWEARLPAAVTGSPVRSGDLLIAGCRDGRIYGLDAVTGEIAWSRVAAKGFGGTAAVLDSTAFLGGFDGIVRALDVRTGTPVWEQETAGRIMASPQIDADGRIIAASYDRTLYSLDRSTGEPVWKRRLGAQLWATPALDDTYIYAAALDGNVTSVNAKWGSVAWTFRSGGEIYSAPAVGLGTVVFGCEDGNVYGVDATSGKLRWKTPTGKSVGGGAVIVDSLGVIGNDAGVLSAIHVRTGNVAWTYRAGAAVKSTPIVEEGVLLFSSHDGYIHALGTDGSLVGRFPIDAPMASSPSLAGDSLYVGAHDGRIIALKLR